LYPCTLLLANLASFRIAHQILTSTRSLPSLPQLLRANNPLWSWPVVDVNLALVASRVITVSLSSNSLVFARSFLAPRHLSPLMTRLLASFCAAWTDRKGWEWKRVSWEAELGVRMVVRSRTNRALSK